MRHFLKYNVVGLLGNTLKLTLLALLHELGGLGYLAATALAVEAAMLHNFLWHLGWTWRERCVGNTLRERMARLAWFQLSNGGVALVMNLLVMRVLVGETGMHYLPANLIATAVAGIINFVIADLVIFRDASARTLGHRIRLVWLRS
jgi:putative flippase GtrA